MTSKSKRSKDAGKPEKSKTSGNGADIFEAISNGDLNLVKNLVEADSNLVHKTEWYLRPLHYAVRSGSTDLVKYLLEKGANPSPPEETCIAPSTLEIAKLHQHREIVQLLEQAIQASYNSGPDGEALCRAISSDNPEYINALIERNPQSVKEADRTGNTPLHMAVLAGRKDLVDRLIDLGANIDAIRCDGKTPAFLSLYKHQWWMNRFKFQDLEMLEHLIKKGAHYNICLAAARGDLARVQELVKEDKSLVNFLDPSRKRPLSCAAEAGHTEVVQFLLDNGADPNKAEFLCDENGYALFGACWGKHKDCVELLLKHGADPNTEVDSSGNPLSAAGEDKEIVDLLKASGAKPLPCFSIPTYTGKESLASLKQWFSENPEEIEEALIIMSTDDEQSKQAYLAIFELAFKSGAKPDKIPLYVFERALTSMPDVAKLMLESGVSANLRCKYTGATIQHNLASSGIIDGIKILLPYKPDLNSRDYVYKTTPLSWAVRNDQNDMVEFLLENGAKPNLDDDKFNLTPLYWAERVNNKDIIDVLKKHGAVHAK